MADLPWSGVGRSPTDAQRDEVSGWLSTITDSHESTPELMAYALRGSEFVTSVRGQEEAHPWATLRTATRANTSSVRPLVQPTGQRRCFF